MNEQKRKEIIEQIHLLETTGDTLTDHCSNIIKAGRLQIALQKFDKATARCTKKMKTLDEVLARIKEEWDDRT